MCHIKGVLFFCWTLLIVGCGGAADKPEFLTQLVPVSGKFTLNGQPQGGVSITFHPSSADDGASRTAFGETAEDGTFTIYTPPSGSGIRLQDYPGTISGTYRITFSRFLLPDGTTWDPKTSQEGPMNVGAVETIPTRLTDPNTTTIEVQIPEAGNTDLVFDIKSGKKR